jgi:hypothetical protein
VPSDESERLLRANPDLVFIEEGDGSVLFDPRTGEMKELNRTGAFIYQKLDGRHRRQEILDLLLKAYTGADRDEVSRDLDSFLQELVGARAIGIVE